MALGPSLMLECEAKKYLQFRKFFGKEMEKYLPILEELARTAYFINPKSESEDFDYGFCENAHDSFLSILDAGKWGEHLFEDWNYVSMLEVMVFFARNIVRDFDMGSTIEKPIQTVLMYELESMGLVDQTDPDTVGLIALNINKRTFGKMGEGNFLKFKDPAEHGIDCRNWSLIHMQNAWGFEYEWPENCKAYDDLYTERMED